MDALSALTRLRRKYEAPFAKREGRLDFCDADYEARVAGRPRARNGQIALSARGGHAPATEKIAQRRKGNA
jgi:hypothetical protein